MAMTTKLMIRSVSANPKRLEKYKELSASVNSLARVTGIDVVGSRIL
jgi:hypothetical protein